MSAFGKDKFFVRFHSELNCFSAREYEGFLIAGANKYIELERDKKLSEGNEDIANQCCHHYLELFHTNGPTEEFLNHLNEQLKHLRFELAFGVNEPGNYDLIPIWNQQHPPTITEYVLYPLACAISARSLDNLKRCKYKNCTNFFLGRKNQKWCSDNCGSKFRVKKQRRKQFIRRNS